MTKNFGKIEKINSPEAAQKFVGKLLYIKRKNYLNLKKMNFIMKILRDLMFLL